MWQVARATSAAPTYFEPFKIEIDTHAHYYSLIDGGVFANNPAMCAYVEAKMMYPDADDFILVSIGTGELVQRLPHDEADSWGLAQWARPLLGVVFDGVSDTVDYQLQKLLPLNEKGRCYYRFQARLDNGGDKMDDVSPRNIRFLHLLAEDLVKDNRLALEELCRKLIEK
jgi:predicted acylesterase/phospholipase RssA